jgi:hypothetical protein
MLVSARCTVDDRRQLAGAPQAHLGEQIDEGVDALGRQQLAMRAPVTLLTTALAPRFPAQVTRRSTACI